MTHLDRFIYSSLIPWTLFFSTGSILGSSTPRPTATPIPEPPSTSPGIINMILLFGVLVVLVILFGIALNRRRIF